MDEEKNLAAIHLSANDYNTGFLVLASMILSWIFIHRWNQRATRGPKTWPLIGAAIEQLMNYDRMHDWLVEYLAKSRTVVVPMPSTTYTYIADPANVEHVLKANFANYPKVKKRREKKNNSLARLHFVHTVSFGEKTTCFGVVRFLTGRGLSTSAIREGPYLILNVFLKLKGTKFTTFRR